TTCYSRQSAKNSLFDCLTAIYTLQRAALFITREVNRMPRPVSEQIQGTYFRLRFIVAVIGLLFPVILYFGGRMNHFGLRGSMSAYYWATKKAQCPCGDDPEHSGKCKK